MVAAITAGITLLIPNIYTGRAVLMPPQQQQSTAAMMIGQLGAIAGAAGAGLGIKNPNDLYVGILSSRTIADAIIRKFHLKNIYETETEVATRSQLAKRTTVNAGVDGLIVVEVKDEDPIQAAAMANMYVQELQSLTSNLAVTEAAQRRLFFENQMVLAKENLANAEISLKGTQERTGILQLDQQGRMTIEAIALLRAQIVGREIELASMRSYATEHNPELVKIEQELRALKSELQKTERSEKGDLFLSTKNMPSAGLEYARKYRDVKYFEAIFELMAKQHELAKIDESRDTAVVQVVDVAVPLDEKSGPPRTFLVLLSFVVTSLVVCVAVVLTSRSRSIQSLK